jgi:hypothetical protein
MDCFAVAMSSTSIASRRSSELAFQMDRMSNSGIGSFDTAPLFRKLPLNPFS